VPFLRRYTVFNVAQCDNLPSHCLASAPVLPEREIVPQAEALAKATLADILVKVGTLPDEAEIVASHLVDADLRGVRSHGLLRMLKYVEQIESGYIANRATVTAWRERRDKDGENDAHSIEIKIALRNEIHDDQMRYCKLLRAPVWTCFGKHLNRT
jgi:hypothetical protein